MSFKRQNRQAKNVLEMVARKITDDFGSLALLLAANLVLIGIFGFWLRSNIDADEVEHTHVTWALNQGVMPFRDIHQNHTPTLWILVAPLLHRLSETAQTVVGLRWLCVAAILGTLAIGLLVIRELREIIGPINRYHVLSFSMLLLAFIPVTELYRFRPDPWMSFFATVAIWATMCMRRGPMRYALFCGIATGIAVAFSPKVAPLVFLMPIICLFETIRRRSWRSLLPLLPCAAGFFIGVAPLVWWIVAKDLWHGFSHSCMSGNSKMMNINANEILCAISRTSRFVAIPLLGLMWLLYEKRHDVMSLMTPWSPLAVLATAAVLTWSVVVATPSHNIYNLQAAAAPLAILGACFLAKIAEVLRRQPKQTLRPRIFTVCVFCAVVTLTLELAIAECFREPGQDTISAADLQRLIDLTREKDATCVALAPWHPVFCRDATSLYLGWDFMFFDVPWAPEAWRGELLAMWRQAAVEIVQGQATPTLVFSDHSYYPWKLACEKKVISKDQYKKLMQFLHEHCREVAVDPSGMPKMFVRP